MTKVLSKLYDCGVVLFGEPSYTRHFRKLSTEKPTDSIMGAWYLNKTLTRPTSNFEVSLIVNMSEGDMSKLGYGNPFVTICIKTGGNLNRLFYGGFRADGTYDSFYCFDYTGDGWIGTQYGRILTIYSDTDNEIFKSWLKANGTKQDDFYGTWVFKDGIDLPSATTFMDFECDGNEYNRFVPTDSGIEYQWYTVRKINSYVDGSWTSEANKVITIKSFPYSNVERTYIDDDFITWLKANATKQ